MANWTATTTTTATPEQLLEVLTHPEEIRRWSPVDFELDELDAARLAPGTRARVTGRTRWWKDRRGSAARSCWTPSAARLASGR